MLMEQHQVHSNVLRIVVHKFKICTKSVLKLVNFIMLMTKKIINVFITNTSVNIMFIKLVLIHVLILVHLMLHMLMVLFVQHNVIFIIH